MYEFRSLKEYDIIKVAASSMMEALQEVSKKWFNGDRVVDYVKDSAGRVTLLSSHPNGNVIGRVFVWDEP